MRVSLPARYPCNVLSLIGTVLCTYMPIVDKVGSCNSCIVYVAAGCRIQCYKGIARQLLRDSHGSVVASLGRSICNAVGTFPGTVAVNIWEGQLASLAWAWDHGRIFQTASMFMLGMVIGPKRTFPEGASAYVGQGTCYFIDSLLPASRIGPDVAQFHRQ